MNASSKPVTLQVSLSPADYRHAPAILSHQLRFWRGQVQEILLVVDESPPKGRFADNWNEGRETLWHFLKSLTGVRVVTVDYSIPAVTRVARCFFNHTWIPKKDFRGGPYYSYFFGLHAAAHDMILHCDSDMFFGGSAEHWLPAALDVLAQPEFVAFTAPLPGPHSSDRTFRQLSAEPFTIANQPGFLFKEMSTRVFLFDRARFREKVGLLHAGRPGLRQQLIASVDGNPRFELPEKILSRRAEIAGVTRFDFAGPEPGCWSLHPPYRCRDFFEKLPSLIERMEKNQLPEGQLGDHDINASMVDWSEAEDQLRQRRWWRRLGKRLFSLF